MNSDNATSVARGRAPAHRTAPCNALWALVFCLAASSALAQSAGVGRSLFDDTINASGLNGLTGNCTSCHRTVQERRIKLGGSAFAEISPALAGERLRLAIQSVGAMQQFAALSTEQVNDLAAYLADTPRRSAAALGFSASAVNAVSPAQFVELQHAEATSEGLSVVSVALTGSSADNARFTRRSDTCDQQTLVPSGSCRVTLTYTAPDAAPAATSLTLTLRQGSSAAFTRTVALSGSVASATPPEERPDPAPDSGGGALGAAWLAGLACAVAVLNRAGMRRDRLCPSRQPSPNPGDPS